MNNFLKMAAFCVAVLGAYTLFATVYVPYMPVEREAEVSADAAPSTEEGLVLLGQKIFEGKGACTLCHNRTSGRAPLLDDIGVVAGLRIKDKRYKGGAMDAYGYIYESMVRPSAFVVAGYGAAGSGDTVSPMPDVSSAAIGLSEVEIRAVASFLMKQSGLPTMDTTKKTDR